MERPNDAHVIMHRVDAGAGPVVRRSWLLQEDHGGPLLTGLFGFPWREPIVQAKCTRGGAAGRADPFGAVLLDRTHRFVPSPDCTCGIYATDEPDAGWLQRRYLRARFVVTGFVRLSGRILVRGPVYRAEVAEVLGPLTITLPGPGPLRRLGAGAGVNQVVRRVVAEGGGFAVRHTHGRRGLSVGEWHKQTEQSLRQRYRAETTGLFAVPDQ